MIRIQPAQVTPQFQALFDMDDPASVRLRAVLQGKITGEIFTDVLLNPSYGVVRESAGSTTFISRAIDAPTLAEAVDALKQSSHIVIGLLPDDPRLELVPNTRDRDSLNLEFLNRSPKIELDNFLRLRLSDCELRPLDRELFPRCVWYEVICREYGNAEGFFQGGLGFCLTRGQQLLGECFLGPAVDGVRELGIRTAEEQRGQGFATLLCSYAIQECERRGERTYWSTSLQNKASQALARKLGFGNERQYHVMVWVNPDAP